MGTKWYPALGTRVDSIPFGVPANKIFAEYVAILGDDELAAGAAKIKCMADGFETSVKLDELVDYFAD